MGFNTDTFVMRRKALRQKVNGGAILLLSATFVPRNYPAEIYPFHQDSTFRYYTGLNDLADAALLIDESGRETLFCTTPDPDDVIWTGPVPSNEALAESAGIANSADMSMLPGSLPRHTHFIKAYDGHLAIKLAEWMGLSVTALAHHESVALRRAIIAQRNYKTADEVAEMEEAIGVTKRMIAEAEKMNREGVKESDVLAALMGPAIARERAQAFEPIVTVHGETLHNRGYGSTLTKGRMLVIDCGAESPNGYCADLTRSFAVAGAWNARQRAIYDAVSLAQKAGIAETARRGASQYDVHIAACRALAGALAQLGLMRGDLDEAVKAGAHALFLPHGIGHMLGLDAHDMENLGDDVGYAEGTQRSTQFGLNALRLARTLEPGFVLTVEPGCYFIPELIDRWKATRHLDAFICYDEVEKFRDFGGIRIEDDILITETGSRILG